ncbi:uncharacterized protein LY79DRAFT_228703 [Colletotrichum navitas]|uniref:Uncharacterized protein n=1 Tax=Colletotrichum navitas TaxID=681940 RepID=A0AAD8PYP2_9PEZI|nr:uncharacterized protein LY79DRAFT_228703 [Colletotrichum navitas]KAK1590065.1 hypothetical protein LY79DRAFT_228703 [Colletotrichum navitas]
MDFPHRTLAPLPCVSLPCRPIARRQRPYRSILLPLHSSQNIFVVTGVTRLKRHLCKPRAYASIICPKSRSTETPEGARVHLALEPATKEVMSQLLPPLSRRTLVLFPVVPELLRGTQPNPPASLSPAVSSHHAEAVWHAPRRADGPFEVQPSTVNVFLRLNSRPLAGVDPSRRYLRLVPFRCPGPHR